MGQISAGVPLFIWWAGLATLLLGVPAVALRLTRFARLGVEVRGTVTEVRVDRRRGVDAVALVVRFTDPASEREVVGGPACGRVPLVGWPGQSIVVRYLPGAPERFQIGPQTGPGDAALTALLVMTLGSVALVLTRWTDPDAIATSIVLACSGLALGTAGALNHRTDRHERRSRLRDRGVVVPGELVGTFVVDGGADGAHRYHPVVTFTSAHGDRVTGVDLGTHNRHGYPAVDGLRVAVRHLPQDPSVFRVDSLSRPPSGVRVGPAEAAVGLVAAMVCCGVAITLVETLPNR
ncbi:DUF3592 domain-containing protein [Kitasatospora viridis]|uniref:Uncharacterized protein DUF3592 n=1 Tax=Kitasatospora viridis TaxID=281105 RepID=A0A561UGS7_9ACTN|nr:DUF3592 domain-containing protein [Kitasatospora viridis]TWF98553.1 uncharacterized protein DUF3592 [Kitasatospora viridis]